MRIAVGFLAVLAGCIPGLVAPDGWGSIATPVEATATETAAPEVAATEGEAPTEAPSAPVEVGPVVTNASAPAGNLVVYVHGSGARVFGGSTSDAPRWVSSTVAFHNLAYADIPAFEGTHDDWRYIMSCAQRYYDGLPVTLVDQQPTSGDYLLAMVGGRMETFNTYAWGEADTGKQQVVERGTGFVFSASIEVDNRAHRICETLTHEIGHILGLDHVESCPDVMSGNAGCQWTGARAGFLEGTRAILATSLARWRETATRPGRSS